MSTILYPSPIFGPVHSRRLGISLGVNLMPSDGKVCTFDCIYCECGFNKDYIPHQKRPTREEVSKALEAKLRQMEHDGQLPDVITFAGNGEPTGHPHFDGIIDDTIVLRQRYCPNAKVSVLSNATFIFNDKVRDALMKVDNNIQKLDTVNMEYIHMVDRPVKPSYQVEQIIEGLKAFNGHVIIQSMFMKGTTEIDGQPFSVDNTGESYVAPWLETIKAIQPSGVMVYTIDRETPDHRLQKASREELDAICERVKAVGISCTASY